MKRDRAKPVWRALAVGLLAAAVGHGQQAGSEQSKLDLILQQLAELRQENQELRKEINDLRNQVGLLPARPPEPQPEQPDLQEKIAVLNQRVEDLDTGKVEAAAHF